MKSNINLIIIDANFILLPFQFKIDYFTEIRNNLDGKIRFIVFQQILNELEAKKKREPKAIKFARVLNSGLVFLERNKKIHEVDFLKDVKNIDETTDEFLLRKLIKLKNENNNVFLATNDSDLRKKAKNLGLSVIFLRQRKYLCFERS